MTSQRITRARLAELLELEEGFVVQLEERSIVTSDPRGTYGGAEVERVRVCWTMHHQLGVNMAGLEVVVGLLERWQEERNKTSELVRRLREQLDER